MIAIKINPDPTFTPKEILNHISESINHVEYDYRGENPTTGRRFINTVNEGARALWDEGAKIKAIKFIRTFFPMNLSDAKQYCERNFN